MIGKSPSLIVLAVSIFITFSISTAAEYDPEIYHAQKTLKEIGYNPGILDGLWGETTRKAVKEFQLDKGLPVTGKLDEKTRNKLSERNRNGKIGNISVNEVTLKDCPIEKGLNPANTPLIISQPEENGALSVKGPVIYALKFVGNKLVNRPKLFVDNVMHKIVGRVKMCSCIFESEEDHPMIFRCVYGKGYVYLEGKGKITMEKTGEIIKLGY